MALMAENQKLQTQLLQQRLNTSTPIQTCDDNKKGEKFVVVYGVEAYQVMG